MMYGDKKCRNNTCEHCGTRLTKVFDDSTDLFCKPCTVETELVVANAGWYNLIISAFICIFHFEFISAIGMFWYGFDALFKLNDFNPKTGRFYKQGYIKPK